MVEYTPKNGAKIYEIPCICLKINVFMRPLQYMLLNIIKPQMNTDFQVAYPRSYIHYSYKINIKVSCSLLYRSVERYNKYCVWDTFPWIKLFPSHPFNTRISTFWAYICLKVPYLFSSRVCYEVYRLC